MKLKCSICGDLFEADTETKELLNDGYISLSDVQQGASCDECSNYNSYQPEEETYSDADPGL